MKRKYLIAVPLITAALAVSTGVGMVFAKSTDQPAGAQANYAAAPANPGNSSQVGYCGGYGGMMGWNRGIVSTQVAALLGTTVADLQTQLASGKTLAELAAAKGVSQDQLVQTMLAPMNDQMALMLKYGYLTQDQIDSMTQQMKTRLQTVITSQVNSDTDGDMWDFMRDMMGGNGVGMIGRWANPPQQEPGTPNTPQQPQTAPRNGFGGMMGGGGIMGWR